MTRKNYLYKDKCWSETLDKELDSNSTLIICFGSSTYSFIQDAIHELSRDFQKSIITSLTYPFQKKYAPSILSLLNRQFLSILMEKKPLEKAET